MSKIEKIVANLTKLRVKRSVLDKQIAEAEKALDAEAKAVGKTAVSVKKPVGKKPGKKPGKVTRQKTAQ